MARARVATVIAVGLLTTVAAVPVSHAKDSSGSDPAAFLVKPAEQALADRKYGLAVSLWRGIVAIRGDGDEAAWKLAEAWTLAGEFEAAVEELERYAAAVDDTEKKERARDEIRALGKRPKGFSGKVFVVDSATKQAADAFKRGRALFKKKKYADAVALFKAGTVMAPDMPGPYRELGEALGKLGRAEEATDFFVRYLKLRPFGKNADVVRKRLTKAGAVGKLTIESSFECEQLWMNRQPVPVKKLPAKDLVVAPGRYRLLCYNEKLHFARYINADVAKGNRATAKFEWAVVENALDPWGRIVLENPDDPDEMSDIGLWREIGVPVPDDRRSLKVKLRSADGTKSKETHVKLEAGKRVRIEW
jgi:tetratricopeptide (TPR) repeat protein